MVCSIPNVATRGEWGAPEPLETSNACRRDLVWSTPYGCPVCQRSEYHQSFFFFPPVWQYRGNASARSSREPDAVATSAPRRSAGTERSS
jgi:hypothetical protein